MGVISCLIVHITNCMTEALIIANTLPQVDYTQLLYTHGRTNTYLYPQVYRNNNSMGTMGYDDSPEHTQVQHYNAHAWSHESTLFGNMWL